MSSIINIRASSLSELFDCPARWNAKHILGMRLPTTSNALLGTALHASTALYDQSVLDNADITIEEAKAAAVDSIHNPTEEVEWGEDRPTDIEKVALALHDRYCYEIAPKQNYIAVELQTENIIIEDLGISLSGTTDRLYQDEDGNIGISDLKSGIS